MQFIMVHGDKFLHVKSVDKPSEEGGGLFVKDLHISHLYTLYSRALSTPSVKNNGTSPGSRLASIHVRVYAVQSGWFWGCGNLVLSNVFNASYVLVDFIKTYHFYHIRTLVSNVI